MTLQQAIQLTEPTVDAPPTGKQLPVLSAIGLRKSFRSRRAGFLGRSRGLIQAVTDVSFAVEHGKTLGIVGESGCGKSTTGRLILRLIEPDAGDIRFMGLDVRGLSAKELRGFRQMAQIVFQDPYGSLNPRMTAAASVAFNLSAHGFSGKQRLERTQWALEHSGIPWSFATRYPHELSGGQRQRVNIARAIALRPKLIVLDEPVSALDKSIQAQVLTLLQNLQRELGLTYLFISHDLHVVRYVSHHVLVMYLGQVVESGPVENVYLRPSHPYTRALLASAVDADAVGHRPETLKGEIPSPLNPPSGCRFHTRCPIAQPICRQIAPPMLDLGDGHTAACHALQGYAPIEPTLAFSAPAANVNRNEGEPDATNA